MFDLNRSLSQAFIDRMVASPEGRAALLSQASEAEDGGERRLFERLSARVADAKLQRLIQRHCDDETRHARLFKERAEAVGVPLRPVPEDLKIIERLNQTLKGVFERPINSELDVMEAYLLLQVLEERAVTQFPMFEEAFRKVDPTTADVFAEVAKDEERHLRYCHAISKRYAPDEATLKATLQRFREAETDAFTANSRAVMAHFLDHGLVDLGTFGKWAWRAVGQLADLLGRRQLTPFAGDPVPAAA